MKIAPALTAIEAVAHQHRGGHRCQDGQWYNDNAGNRVRCAVRDHLDTAANEVRALSQTVHNAAHDDAAVDAMVAGLTSTPIDEMLGAVRDSWRIMVRLGLEALAHHLDTDDSPEGRRAAAAAELVRQAGITPPPVA